ncbi:MAG: hypothetical protein M3N43_08355 [Actinomycetota bacterium]|nr:hypothetical protein [Actinomycetota bacterium]
MLEHPAWCDPKFCTAVLAAEFQDCAGEHVSVELVVPLDGAMLSDDGWWTSSPSSARARLTQVAAPWMTETYVRLAVGDVELCLPYATAGVLAGHLVGMNAAAGSSAKAQVDAYLTSAREGSGR